MEMWSSGEKGKGNPFGLGWGLCRHWGKREFELLNCIRCFSSVGTGFFGLFTAVGAGRWGLVVMSTDNVSDAGVLNIETDTSQ